MAGLEVPDKRGVINVEYKAIRWFYNISFDEAKEIREELSDTAIEHITAQYKNRAEIKNSFLHK